MATCLDIVPFEPPVRIHNSKDHCNQLRDQQNMDFALPSIRCSAGWHDYEPLYTVKMDVIGFEEDPYQLRMRWKCTRCGEEITLPADVSTEKA